MKLLERITPKEYLSLDNWRRWESNRWIAVEYLKMIEAEELPRQALEGCRRCGRHHTERPTHSMMFTEGTGMSPICEVCWQELATPEARMPWYRALWWLWEMHSRYDGCPWGSHTHGEPPFERGDNRVRWEMIEATVLAGL